MSRREGGENGGWTIVKKVRAGRESAHDDRQPASATLEVRPRQRGNRTNVPIAMSLGPMRRLCRYGRDHRVPAPGQSASTRSRSHDDSSARSKPRRGPRRTTPRSGRARPEARRHQAPARLRLQASSPGPFLDSIRSPVSPSIALNSASSPPHDRDGGQSAKMRWCAAPRADCSSRSF